MVRDYNNRHALEQKLRSEEQRSSFGVPRSLMPVYFLRVSVSLK